MNYYDELLKNIDDLIKDNSFEDAKRLILNELEMVYIPKDIETKLKEYLNIIKQNTFIKKEFSDEQIEEYLFADERKQLLAVEQLNKRNLRDYIDIVDKYLKSDGYLNSKVLLIDSLIRQEINYVFVCKKDNKEYQFNGKNLKIIEETKGFIRANEVVSDYYLKDPSKLNMAMQLIFKEIMLSLPLQLNEDEGLLLGKKVIAYIDKAFNC